MSRADKYICGVSPKFSQCHCEEGEARRSNPFLDCFARYRSLAMTLWDNCLKINTLQRILAKFWGMSIYILFVFFLIAAIDQKFIASAEEAAADPIMARPIVKYESGRLRDPFRTYLIKEESRQVSQENMDLAKPELDLGKLQVQGIIWGVPTPQVIINNKVYKIGDLIEGAEILSIEKKGIGLSFNGAILNLNAPGQDSV